MIITRWIGGESQEIMAEGIVAASYNIVQNEVPIYLNHNFDSRINSVYFTEIPHRYKSLIVYLDNEPIQYREIDTQLRRFEIIEKNKTGLLRFDYVPNDDDDYFGTQNLAVNRIRTNVVQRFIKITDNVVNQMRAAISNMEVELDLLQSRWIGGRFTDSFGVINGDPNTPETIESNIIPNQTLYNSIIFEEIAESVERVAATIGYDLSTYSSKFRIRNQLIGTAWIESIRSSINELEGQI